MIPDDTKNACVIIGNGTSVLDAEAGDLIDQFGTVVRFNLWETKGYEKHVGTKTNIWFSGLGMRKGDWRLEREYRRIVLHSWVRDAGKCPTVRSFSEVMPDGPFMKLDHALLDEMAQFAETDYRYWSTGAIAAWMMARQFPIVHLHGFDWWDRPEQHYFNPKANRGTLHKPEIEREFIKHMVIDGKAVFL